MPVFRIQFCHSHYYMHIVKSRKVGVRDHFSLRLWLDSGSVSVLDFVQFHPVLQRASAVIRFHRDYRSFFRIC
jgi:hypothetical protein